MKCANRLALITLAVTGLSMAQRVELVPVVSKVVSSKISLPGEFQPFQKVELHAKVRGYVERVFVDRGSAVRQGQVLVSLTAPEIEAQVAEAESKVQAAEGEQLQAEAELNSAQTTYDRLKKAAETPGAIAGNELVLAEERVRGLMAAAQSKRQAKAALEQTAKAQQDLRRYLKITAPFGGIVTDRLVHPGALVGPGPDPALLIVQEIARLRLVVAVPEQNVGVIEKGARVEFTVPAFPQRSFFGRIARSAHSLEEKTRTMAVELDVMNADGRLYPGMYPSVNWPVQRAGASLLVPKTSVVTTTERTFVVKEQDGRAQWVTVTKGTADGDMVEIRGQVKAGDRVVRRATDEMREGMALR